MSPRRVPLSEDEARAVRGGAFVRVALPERLAVDTGYARTAVVGLAGGRVVAYANLCRHQALPLEGAFDEETAWPDDAPAALRLPLAPLTDDGAALICLRHGALYRKEDGVCTEGPCEGAALVALAVSDEGAIVLELV